jgi:anti-sigma regulatory factor (Ser/Thr protein kinase)
VSVEAHARSFDAQSKVLSDVRRFVASEANRLTFSRFADDLQLAVTEACANAIVHSGTDEIRVTVTPLGGCIEITIEDDGIYQRTLPLPELDGQGHRGLHLMAAMVDDFSLHRGTEERQGTTVTLVKCKDPSRPPASH